MALAVAASLFVALTVPRLIPAMLVLSGCIALAIMLNSGIANLGNRLRKPAILALGALVAYLFVNSSWAIDQGAAFAKSATILVIVAAMSSLAFYSEQASDAACRRIAVFSTWAFLAGAAILSIELMFDQPLWRFAHNYLPGLVGDADKHVLKENGKIVRAELYIPNRNVTAAVILVWPVLLFAGALPEAWRRVAAVLVAASIIASALISQSATAGVAVAAGFAVLGAGFLSRRAVKWTLTAAWIIAVAFAVPLGAMPAKLGWTQWTGLASSSAAARFFIWQYTAEKVKERPLAGIGVRGTRVLQEGISVPEGSRPVTSMRPRPGRHAHNGFLQIWLELGAMGAALMLAMGLALLREIGRLPARESVFGYSLFASICTVAAFGYGIWQTWLLSAYLLSTAMFLLAVRLRAEDNKSPSPDA